MFWEKLPLHSKKFDLEANAFLNIIHDLRDNKIVNDSERMDHFDLIFFWQEKSALWRTHYFYRIAVIANERCSFEIVP